MNNFHKIIMNPDEPIYHEFVKYLAEVPAEELTYDGKSLYKLYELICLLDVIWSGYLSNDIENTKAKFSDLIRRI